MVSALRSALVKKKSRASIFIAADRGSFLEEMAWVGGAYQYAKEKGANGQNKGSFGVGRCRFSSMGWERRFFQEGRLKYSTEKAPFHKILRLFREL